MAIRSTGGATPGLRPLLGFAATLAAAGASAAHAQPRVEPPQAASVEAVTVVGKQDRLGLDAPVSSGSRLDIPVIETPGTIQVITADTIHERALTTVLQAETQAAGVTLAATPGNGGLALSYRGFSGVGSIQQIYDGVQLAVGAGTVTFPFDVWNVDKIEILGGPATVLYGFGGTGGTVDVTPRRPDTQAFHNTLQVTAGSLDTFQQALDSTGPINSQWAYRFDISHVSSDGYVDRGSSRSVAASASLQYKPTPDLTFVLQDDYGNIEPMNYWGTPLINGHLVEATRTRNYEVASDPIRWLDNVAQFKADWRVNAALALRNDLYFLNSFRHWRQLTNYVYQPATGLINRTSYREVFHHESQVGDQGVATLKGTLFGLRNETSLGFEIQGTDFQTSNNTPFGGSSNVDPFNPSPGPFLYGVGTHPIFHTQTDQYAVFTEDRLFLTPRLTLVGGFRFDELRLDYMDQTIGTALYDKGFDFVRHFDPLSGRAGAVYQAFAHTFFYAQYSTGNDAVGNLISQSFTQANFGLTNGRQYEVGVKQTFWGSRGEATAAAYDIVKHDLLVPDPLNPTVSQQVGAQSSRGLEGSVTVAFPHGVGVQANGTILHAQFDDFSENVAGVPTSRNGKLPPFVPEKSANVFATWDVVPAWQVRAGLQYVGRRFANNANTFTLPQYTIVSAGVRWRATPRFSIDVKVDNVADQTYAQNGVNGFSQYILGPPRTVLATADLAF